MPKSENTKLLQMYFEISALRFAVAQMIANNCNKEADPQSALRHFSQQLYTRVEGEPIPNELQDTMALMSKAVDDVLMSARAALKY